MSSVIKDVEEETAIEVITNAQVPKLEDIELLAEFRLPERNWEAIIDFYNKHSRTKFALKPLDCVRVLEYTKRSVPIRYTFDALGYSSQKVTSWETQVAEKESRIEAILNQKTLTEEDQIEFQELKSHPLRILFEDIERAKGVAAVLDWERFNHFASVDQSINLAKMKMKFKEFDNKGGENQSVNVQIKLGGDFLTNL